MEAGWRRKGHKESQGIYLLTLFTKYFNVEQDLEKYSQE
jgi:hypothetical protein